jgi:hypothetical protein
MQPLLRYLPLFAILFSMPASAQFGAFEALFKSVNSLTFYVHGGDVIGASEVATECAGFGLCGMGAEVLIDLPTVHGVHFEMGLGTNFIRGFASREPSMDLRGSLRTLPMISVYGSRAGLLGTPAITPYAGVNFGLSTLWNTRAYDDTGAVYEMRGETFEYGVAAGFYLSGGPLPGLFMEGSYRQRRFASLDWGFPGPRVLPANWPRELDMSGWLVSVGWQFRLKE